MCARAAKGEEGGGRLREEEEISGTGFEETYQVFGMNVKVAGVE